MPTPEPNKVIYSMIGVGKTYDKKVVLKASAFAWTKQIGSAAKWTMDHIQKRQQQMADLALTVWPR